MKPRHRKRPASEILEEFEGPSVGLDLRHGRAVALGVKKGDEIEMLILEGEFELPADLGRTLRKRIDESDDKRRYVIASKFSEKRQHWLYYDVTSDSYVMGDVQRATAFKRRAIAEAVMALLRSEWHEIIECTRLSNGTLRINRGKKAR